MLLVIRSFTLQWCNVQKFPSEFPLDAIKQLTLYVTKQDPDLGRVALAAWNILGYAGHMSFGSSAPLMNGVDMEAMMAVPSLEELQLVADPKTEMSMIPPWGYWSCDPDSHACNPKSCD
jgi:hypothetical protein